MKKTLFTTFVLLSHKFLLAQLPEDALRLSWTTPSGTAREQAIGGAIGSLGGEISSSFVNPAGLGMFKKGEFVLSPGISFQKDNSSYLGNGLPGNNQFRFNLGTSGFVLPFASRNGNTNAWSIAVNRTTNFNGNIHYKGENDLSSFSEQYVEEYKNSGLPIDDINGAINNPQLSYGTRMALYTYLIDTATIGGVHQVIGLPLMASRLNQENNISTRGGITEIAFGIAANNHDKWYIGGTLGIPIVSYTRKMSFTETDATGNTNNNFGYSTYSENYTSKGVGVNIKLGVIFKPINAWRVGLAIHSPSLYALTDNISASMTTNTENYRQVISISSATLDNGSGVSASETRYDLVSPWRFMLGTSYVFGELADVTQQKGFISADAEYVTTNSPRFNNPTNTNDNSYFSNLNAVIKNYYKGTFNLRLGGELKFNILAVRAGVAYYTDPYKQSGTKADHLYISGGVGYRNKGIFLDLSYIQGFTQDVNFPYRLANKANTYATVKENSGTILLSIGFKFE